MSDKDENSTDNELEKYKQLADDYLNGWKRTKADYENLKKESEKNVIFAVQFGNQKLIKDLLDIVENFDLAIKYLPEELKDNNWVKGIARVHDNLIKLLNDYGVSKIEIIEHEFNPEMHEAVGEKEGVENQIIEEISAGYKLHDKVIKPARVIVGKIKNNE